MNDFLHHYVEILSDPAHLAVEVTLMVLVDIIFLGSVWPFIKRHFHKDLAEQHQVLDREHGIAFHGDLSTTEPCRPSEGPYDYERSGL